MISCQFLSGVESMVPSVGRPLLGVNGATTTKTGINPRPGRTASSTGVPVACPAVGKLVNSVRHSNYEFDFLPHVKFDKSDEMSTSMSKRLTLITSLPKAGQATDTPVDDVVWAGRGVNLVVVAVASLTPDRGRPTDRNRRLIAQQELAGDHSPLAVAGSDGMLPWPHQGHACFKAGLGEGGKPALRWADGCRNPPHRMSGSSLGAGGGEFEAIKQRQDETKYPTKTTAEEMERHDPAKELESQAEIWKEFQKQNDYPGGTTGHGHPQPICEGRRQRLHMLNKLG